MNLPNRKSGRLKNYDYSQNGAYFITICTKNRNNLFWQNVGATIGRPNDNEYLSAYGKVVEQAVFNITKNYTTITVEHFVIMPNHVHLLLLIQNENGRAVHAPTISTVIQQMKGFVTKQIGQTIWQKSFHDRIIRNEEEYKRIWEYIDTNPLKWMQDCFYDKEIRM